MYKPKRCRRGHAHSPGAPSHARSVAILTDRDPVRTGVSPLPGHHAGRLPVKARDAAAQIGRGHVAVRTVRRVSGLSDNDLAGVEAGGDDVVDGSAWHVRWRRLEQAVARVVRALALVA